MANDGIIFTPDPDADSISSDVAEYNGVHLGPQGCTVYDQRPLICRLFGTTPNLPCPRGQGPETPIEPAVERQVHRLIASTRQRLV